MKTIYKLAVLVAVATELNDILLVDPPIDIKTKDVDALAEEIKECKDFATPDDKFSKATGEVLNDIWDLKPKTDTSKVKTAPAKPEMKISKSEPAEETSEYATETSKNPPLYAEIEDAGKLSELKDIAKANDEFKAIRGKLASYKTFDALRDTLLDILDGIPAEEQSTNTDEKVEEEKEHVEKKAEEQPEKTKKAVEKAIKENKKMGVASKGPGIISTIAELIEKSGKKGIDKTSILEVLVERFPEKEASSMKATINVQVPARISKERFEVEKFGEGLYRKKA